MNTQENNIFIKIFVPRHAKIYAAKLNYFIPNRYLMNLVVLNPELPTSDSLNFKLIS